MRDQVIIILLVFGLPVIIVFGFTLVPALASVFAMPDSGPDPDPMDEVEVRIQAIYSNKP